MRTRQAVILNNFFALEGAMSRSKAKSTNAEAQARQFFDSIHPKGYGQLELRIIGPQTGPRQERMAIR